MAISLVPVVRPCLNETETKGPCIQIACEGMKPLGLPGELVVADNVSIDLFVEIAHFLEVRAVHHPILVLGGID